MFIRVLYLELLHTQPYMTTYISGIFSPWSGTSEWSKKDN